MRRKKDNTAIKFNKISIGLGSPESILSASRGEVLKPETINYRTHKPEGMVCSVKEFLDLLEIMSVHVVNTRE